MDAAAAYEEAYSRAAQRHSLRSGMYSTAAIPIGAAVSPSGTIPAFGVSEKTVSRRADELSLLGALFGLLLVGAISLWRLMAWTCTHIVLPALILFFLVRNYILWTQRVGDIAVNLQDFGAVVRDAADDGGNAFFDYTKARIRQFGRSIRQNQFVIDTIAHSRELLIWTELKVDNVKYNWFWDTAYLRWQETIAFLSRHKSLLLAGVLFTCFASLAIEGRQNHSGVVFLKWNEFQQVWHRPLPEILLRERKASGSNSHYEAGPAVIVLETDAYRPWRGVEEVVVEELAETAESIPVITIVDGGTKTFLAPPLSSESMGDARSDMGEAWRGWCEFCRQWHCCELPY